MDGWPLPAVDEWLNERGAVVTWLPTLRPKTEEEEEVGKDGLRREQELDG